MNNDVELKTILVIEDELALAKALRLKLVSSGFNVVVAGDGKQAIEKLAEGGFDLALVDLLMPDVDGWEVLKICSEKNLKTMVVSNLGQEEDIKKVKELGAIDYLVKTNVSIQSVVDKIKEYLR